MGWYIIAEASLGGFLGQLVLFAEVAIAIGAVIFVHELGHFAVAKWVGVKCEKFYLGFDVFGLKLLSFRYGETEYGIGIVPLGGYVKMLGQEDNPARAAEEIERAKLARRTAEAAPQAGEANPPTAAAPAEPVAATTEQEPAVQFDPRSYLAQSVPKRMAIISAGVVMNVIFAFVVAVVAYMLGVPYVPAQISRVLPGSAAWRAGLQPGDEIIRVGDVENPRYSDLKSEVVLSDLDQGIELLVQRPGRDEPLAIHLVPDRKGGQRLMPTIGVLPPQSLVLSPVQPVWPGSPAARVEPKLQGSERLVAVDGQPLASYIDWLKILRRRREHALQLTLEEPTEQRQSTSAQQRVATLPANPMKTLGLAMTMGPITAIQRGSPAEKAGLKAGDLIVAIDGQPLGDPLQMSRQLEPRAGQTVRLRVQRADAPEPLEIDVEVRNVEVFDWPVPVVDDDTPMTAPEIGIAYHVDAQIASIDPEGPAADSGLAVGDRVIRAAVVLPEESGDEELARLFDRVSPLEFDDEAKRYGWPGFFYAWLQLLPEGAQVELTTKSGKTARLLPKDAHDWFNPERGLNFEMLERKRTASTLVEACSLGFRETLGFLTQVYELIEKLVGNQVSPKVLGGPLTIIDAAGGAASRGLADLLMFLGMLSANLAVINFLPIPVLDGGHMLFLIVEGIRGKPAGEKLTIALHYAGFLLILMLMGFVLFLDVQRLDWFGG